MAQFYTTHKTVSLAALHNMLITMYVSHLMTVEEQWPGVVSLGGGGVTSDNIYLYNQMNARLYTLRLFPSLHDVNMHT